jgi:hypothetical protein
MKNHDNHVSCLLTGTNQNVLGRSLPILWASVLLPVKQGDWTRNQAQCPQEYSHTILCTTAGHWEVAKTNGESCFRLGPSLVRTLLIPGKGGAQVGTEAALDPKFPLEVSATHWRSALRSPSLPGSGPFPFQMEKLVQAELSVDTLFSHTGEGYLGFTF